MRIYPIQNYNIKIKSSPSFNANQRYVSDSFGRKLYKTTTYYFREDLNWNALIEFLCYKFKNVKHVNFINHACSNGMEPLSFIMAFLMKHPDEIDKFTPILAKDIDIDNINAAKKGRCGVSFDDFMRICKYTLGRRNDFLTINKADNPDNLFVMSPNKILTDRVIFEQGDIFEDVEKMPPENTFLACRNFWGYLSKEKQEELAYKLGKQLKGNSTILIGYIDTIQDNNSNYKGYADKLLEKNGFKRCQVNSPLINIMYSKT